MASVERIPARRRRRRTQTGLHAEGQIAKGLIALALILTGLSAPANGQVPTGDASFADFLAAVQDIPGAPQSDGATADASNAATPADGTSAEANTPIGDADNAAKETAAQELLLPQPASEVVEIDAGTAEPNDEALSLADVMASVYRSYPDIIAARELLNEAAGELLSAYGAYDTKFEAHSISEPTGFYRNYRQGLGFARQTWWGGYVSAGYRIGRGFYQPWYFERQTDDAGEFKLAVGQRLLRGRAIDADRVAVFQSSLAQQAATPQLEQAIRVVSQDAVILYWDWLSAGGVLEAQRELLELAVERKEQFEKGAEAGRFPEIDVILNQQLIAERSALTLKAEQKYRATGFKLGLFIRDNLGQPMPPGDEWLPHRFPTIPEQPPFDLNAEISQAVSRRPEPQIIEFQLRQVGLDRRLARNDMLPNLDFIAEGSQDMGERSTKSNDKGDFELIIGITSDVPIQRRKARGKIRSTSAKMVQLNEKLRLMRDKIAAEVRIAHNQLILAEQVIEQSEIAFRTAVETLKRYTVAFQAGKLNVDLIYINLLEVKLNESEIKLVEAQRDWFVALGTLQLALGLDPLDQAMMISELPPSDMPGPGNPPESP